MSWLGRWMRPVGARHTFGDFFVYTRDCYRFWLTSRLLHIWRKRVRDIWKSSSTRHNLYDCRHVKMRTHQKRAEMKRIQIPPKLNLKYNENEMNEFGQNGTRKKCRICMSIEHASRSCSRLATHYIVIGVFSCVLTSSLLQFLLCADNRT